MTIDAPGFYDLPAADYHADPCPAPSLSSSIAKVLCLESPAHAWDRHPRLNPALVREEAAHFDLGTVAHAVLLEGESSVDVIDAKDWRTNVAKDARDAARAAGKVPLLKDVWADVQAMVAAARTQLADHVDDGAAMFTNGVAEQTLIWKEGRGAHAVWCRARLDWSRRTPDVMFPRAVDDYKTTGKSANPDQWSRTLFDNGYDIQVAWYLRGLKVVSGEDATFRFAVQETSAPYALSVIGLGPDALVLAEKKRLYAVQLWRECLKAGRWPTYPTRTCFASLPAWQESWWLEKEMR